MPKLLVILTLFIIFSGCSQEPKSLGLNEKEKLATELIKSTKECKRFDDKLSTSLANDAAVDQVYFAALKAHCIKSDI